MSPFFIFAAYLLLGQSNTSDQNTVEQQAQAEKSAKVQQLLAQLDADTLAQRVAAEKALIAMGPSVLDDLPQITNRTSAEVKERLSRIRKTLETAAVEAATRGTTVTLEGEMPLARALAALEKQTGNRVIGYENRQGAVKTDFDKTPYWQALDQILDQAGLGVNNFPGRDNVLALIARPDTTAARFGNASYEGIFRVEATRVRAVRDLRNPEIDGLRVALEVSWEPRSNPITIMQPLDQLTARADNGDELDVDSRVGMLGSPVRSGESAIELEVPFSLPGREVKKIATLSGNLTVTAPGRVETFQFDDLVGARNVEQTKAGVVILLEGVRKNGQLYEVRIRVRFERAADALQSHLGWIFNNEAYLLDATNNPIKYATMENTSRNRNEVGLMYLFDLENPPRGYKFVYKTPAAIVQKSIKYQLKNIELP